MVPIKHPFTLFVLYFPHNLLLVPILQFTYCNQLTCWPALNYQTFPDQSCTLTGENTQTPWQHPDQHKTHLRLILFDFILKLALPDTTCQGVSGSGTFIYRRYPIFADVFLWELSMCEIIGVNSAIWYFHSGAGGGNLWTGGVEISIYSF